MSRAADFSPATKEALAKRAGYLCSFPGCGAPTVGPSTESDTSTNNTGMACHIAAASAGGSARRVVAEAPPEQLADISNGIWMCYRHGKLIDADESKFSIAMLETWRDLAELKAKLRHELGREVVLDPSRTEDLSLPEGDLLLPSLGAENQAIGDALHFSCLSDIWGANVAGAVRDACIEIVRNAFMHGSATAAKLTISASSITIEDDGAPFNSSELRHLSYGGGGTSLKIVAEQLRSRVVFACKRAGEKNQSSFTFIRSPGDFSQFSPCTITLTFDDVRRGQTSARVIESCDVIYVVLPPYFALSDVFKLPQLLAEAFPPRQGKQVVLVAHKLSQGAYQLIQQCIPDAEIIHFGDVT